MSAPLPSVCLRGAAQVLRPPRDGLPYLRHDHATELSLVTSTVSSPSAG